MEQRSIVRNKTQGRVPKDSQQQELFITRIFNAPRELVWKEWSDPERVKRWWGPKDFTAPFAKIDFREGGTYLYDMRSPDGKDFWSTGIYREIVPLEMIVATDSFADEKGNVVPATSYGMSADFPLVLLVTVTFEEQDGKTVFTLRHAGMPKDTIKDAEVGWNESLDKLAQDLGVDASQATAQATGKARAASLIEPPNRVPKRDLVVKRIIDAPVERVWRAWTDPAYVMLWWGPEDYTSPLCMTDLREGGKYLFSMRAPQDQGGQESYTAGVYGTIVPLERLEFTQSLADRDGNVLEPAQVGMPADFPKELRTTVVLKPKGGMTELTVTEYDWPVGQMYVYSIAGLNQSLEKLAASLAKV